MFIHQCTLTRCPSVFQGKRCHEHIKEIKHYRLPGERNITTVTATVTVTANRKQISAHLFKATLNDNVNVYQDELSGTMKVERLEAYHTAAAVIDNWHYLLNNLLRKSIIFNRKAKPCAQTRTNSLRRGDAHGVYLRGQTYY